MCEIIGEAGAAAAGFSCRSIRFTTGVQSSVPEYSKEYNGFTDHISTLCSIRVHS